jgi:hypothetical protein
MNYEEQIERLISISQKKPLLPETYIPWDIPVQQTESFLPDELVSLHGLPEFNQLTDQQKREIGRHEIVQVMYSYAWSESLLCYFLNRYILSLKTRQVEYRFLIRELIEEFRHQEMFARAIEKLDGDVLQPSRLHQIIGKLTVSILPSDITFMCCLAIEMLADRYGDIVRKAPNMFPVVKKLLDLHNIEESRHILYTKLMLKKYTSKAGFIKRTIYSYTILLNIYFFRTLYVKEQIYARAGLPDSRGIYKKANFQYKKNFGKTCLNDIVDFVHEIKGFNSATRWAWRLLLKAQI